MKINSIIQSTLVRISILIFCIFLIVYFYVVNLYWDREVNQRKTELLSVASITESLVNANSNSIQMYKNDSSLTLSEKAEAVFSLLMLSYKEDNNIEPQKTVGFYDYYFDMEFLLSPNIESNSISDINHKDVFNTLSKTGRAEYFFDNSILDGKSVMGVTIPVFYTDTLIGHVWVSYNMYSLFLSSCLAYSKFLIAGLLIWLALLMIIKKYLKDIELALRDFSQKIVEKDYEEPFMNKLPELNPVFQNIKTHMNNLMELNVELEHSNDKLTTTIQGITDCFFSLDNKWRFTFANKKAESLFNFSSLEGQDIRDLHPQTINSFSYDKLLEAVNEKKSLSWETFSGNDTRHYEYYAYPFSQGVSVFVRDVTELKRQEAELLRLERLNLIGQLAAGISHEVRNPLTTVKGFLQMLESRSKSIQDKEYMEIMISEINRANEIITDFLSIAKVNVESTKKENINKIIEKIFPMLQADALNNNKDIITDLHNVPDLELNESEMRQLILNIVRNGLDETDEGGQVTITTRKVENQVVLTIKDQGKGIPIEVQEKLGTPFVTTKESGTGLGLAISIGIARRHKAKFEYTTGDGGTSFYIVFPS